MARLFFLLGSLLAGISVAMGSWGAHSGVFDEVQSLWIDKGVRYQMFHSLALLCASLLITSRKHPTKPAVLAGFCFLGGIVFFSGSLYLMAFSSLDAGYVTPAGGILFLAGWLCLAACTPDRK